MPISFGKCNTRYKYILQCKNGEIELLELTKRANNSNLPNVEVVDLKLELANGNRSMLSNSLYDSIKII